MENPVPSNDITAFNLLFSELVERLLSMADSPGKSADFLAVNLRSLIGAKTVLVMQCPQQTRHAQHEVVSVFPERRYVLGSHESIQELCILSHQIEKAGLFSPDDEGEISTLLKRFRFGPALISPLQSGGSRIGVILLLDLMDASGLKTILDTLDRLSTVLALVLRNAFLYNNLEDIVAHRTRQLELHSEALARSLREREIMLKEVHHRVKNNLQIVNSLLYLQADSSEDPRIQEVLRKGQQRILSMAMIHEELYRSKDLSSVDLCAYARRLGETFTGLSRNRIRVDCPDGQLLLPITASVPCGLILNEFLANALKHAYSEEQEGEIWIRISETGGRIELVVEDEGIGLPPGFNPSDGSRSGSLGLTLVQGLVDQLNGSLSILSGQDRTGGRKGTRFAVSFYREGQE